MIALIISLYLQGVAKVNQQQILDVDGLEPIIDGPAFSIVAWIRLNPGTVSVQKRVRTVCGGGNTTLKIDVVLARSRTYTT